MAPIQKLAPFTITHIIDLIFTNIYPIYFGCIIKHIVKSAHEIVRENVWTASCFTTASMSCINLFRNTNYFLYVLSMGINFLTDSLKFLLSIPVVSLSDETSRMGILIWLFSCILCNIACAGKT